MQDNIKRITTTKLQRMDADELFYFITNQEVYTFTNTCKDKVCKQLHAPYTTNSESVC